MKVQRSTSSAYSSVFQSQSSTETGDGTSFTLPDDDGEQQTSPSISSSGTRSAANSISSAFWLSQSNTSMGAGSADSVSSELESNDASSSTDNSAADLLSEFAKLANMTPAEKIRDEYLKAHNLTEAQFSQLSPDEQKAINDQIADQIKQQLTAGKKGGSSEEGDATSALSIA